METAVKVETPDHVGDIADRVKRNYKSDNSGSTSRICHKSLLSEMAGGERGALENQKYYMYVPKAHGKPQEITIAQLIPVGRENAISRRMLVALCVDRGLVDERSKDKDRAMRNLLNRERKDYVILNLSDGNGYYRPTHKEMLDLQRFIRQMKSRIKELSADLKPALALYEDYERGRTLEGGRQTKQSRA